MSTEVSLPAAPPGDLTITVSDPTGHQQVVLEGIQATVTAKDVTHMAISSMQLPPNVTWDLRDEKTSRLLSENQSMGELADEMSPTVQLQLQPDAGLA